MTNKIKIGFIILLVIVAGGFLFINNAGNKKTTNNTYNDIPYQNKNNSVTTVPVKNTTTTTSTMVTTTSGPTTHSLADVAKHNNEQSCWTAINGNVYDVTSWIGQHPGGERAILSLCGKDGTSAFTNKHGGQPRPEQELKNFLIGVLK
jgi:cytochrome b involved in lipid metabolism